ncbi:MAG: hypothetical protein ABFC38_12115 [Methanospirillum sp.]
MHRWLLAGFLLLCLVAIGGAVDLSWTDTAAMETEPFTLTEGIVYLSAFSTGGVYVRLMDATGETVDTGLLLESGNVEASKAFRIERTGDYSLSIDGYREWTVTLGDPPEDEDPDAGLEWTGNGVQSTGFFLLEPGTVRLTLSTPSAASADLLDAEGRYVGSVITSSGEGEDFTEIAIARGGQFLINVEGFGSPETWTVSVVPVAGPGPLPSSPGAPTLEPIPVVTPAIVVPSTPVPTEPTVPTAPRFGSRRYLVGNAPSPPPVGISVRGPAAAPTPRTRQFGTGSTSYSPPKGGFARWYPATRWRAGR